MTKKQLDDEKKRLETLKEMEILDTPKEARFDRITQKLCLALNVPISAISLIDTDRQWFKSAQGIDVSETSKEVSFCAHTINENREMVIPDAKKDDRFKTNDLVTGDPNIRFYAGVPITAPNGVRIGALCAIDTQPRELSEDEIAILHDLQAELEAELKK